MIKLDYNPISREAILKDVYTMLDLFDDYEISQKEVARCIGVTDRTIRNWNDNNAFPNAEAYVNLKELYKKVKEERPWR